MFRLLMVTILICSACRGGDGAFSYVYRPAQVKTSVTSFASLPRQIRAAAEMKPVERSAEPPASLTASDGTGLVIDELSVRGAVHDPLMFTELRFVFRNPTDRELEGRFELATPPGAAISRLAMRRVGDAWMEGEVVERRSGQQIYESHLHRRVDPALLEHSAGSRFTARIYPIAARAAVEILVSYSAERSQADEPYRVPLAGLPEIGMLDMAVRDGDRWVRWTRHHIRPSRDFVIDTVVPTRGATAGDMVVVRVSPEATGRPDPIGDLVVLVDTSHSTGADLAQVTGELDRFARKLAESEPHKRLVVLAFDNQPEVIFDGKVGQLGTGPMRALRLRRALGASNLAAALAKASRYRGRLLIVSDGVITAGPSSMTELLEPIGGAFDRVDAVSIGASGDPDRLAELAGRAGTRPGVVLPAGSLAATWHEQLGQTPPPATPVTVAGATWQWPRSIAGLLPGQSALVYARMSRPHAQVRVRLGRAPWQRVDLARTVEALLARQLAMVEIDRMMRALEQVPASNHGRRSDLELDIVEHSIRHRILTPLTALMVLETAADYDRFGLDRSALADILTVDATGVRVLRRSAPRRDKARPAIRSRRIRSTDPAGAIAGRVVDASSGDALVGVTLVATSPSLQGTQSAISDNDGRFAIAGLPAGSYGLTAYYANQTVSRGQLHVARRRTVEVDLAIDTSATGGEAILIRGTPNIDTTSTAQGITLDQSYTRSIPVPGRTFESTLGAAAGSSAESFGVSISASTSVTTRSTTWVEPPAPAPYTGRFAKVMKLLDRGQRHDALLSALRWHGDAPADILALLALGEALEAAGHLALAARAYGSIIDRFPSRADMLRVAAGRLWRLGQVGSSLTIDALERAVRLRPDHPSGHRQLAYAHLRAGTMRRATEVLIAALDQPSPRGRMERARPILRDDLGLVAAAWLARDPSVHSQLRELLAGHDVLVAMDRSLSFVLSWESDVADLDLVVEQNDVEGILEPASDITDGWGPERVTTAHWSQRAAYDLSVEYQSRAMMAAGLGQVHIVEHDGRGGLRMDVRPFVVVNEGALVELGSYRPNVTPATMASR